MNKIRKPLHSIKVTFKVIPNLIKKTRTKTSIRYAKENDRAKRERERKRGRRRDIERNSKQSVDQIDVRPL